MTISEMIERLEFLKKEFGDLEIWCEGPRTLSEPKKASHADMDGLLRHGMGKRVIRIK